MVAGGQSEHPIFLLMELEFLHEIHSESLCFAKKFSCLFCCVHETVKVVSTFNGDARYSCALQQAASTLHVKGMAVPAKATQEGDDPGLIGLRLP